MLKIALDWYWNILIFLNHTICDICSVAIFIEKITLHYYIKSGFCCFYNMVLVFAMYFVGITFVFIHEVAFIKVMIFPILDLICPPPLSFIRHLFIVNIFSYIFFRFLIFPWIFMLPFFSQWQNLVSSVKVQVV